MKVLYLIDTLEVGGAEQSIAEIVSNFQKYEPVVCHIYKGETLKPLYEAKGIPVISLNLPIKSSHSVIIKAILEIIDQHKPALIHASLYRSMMISRKIKQITKIPIVNSFVSDSYSKARYSRLKFRTRLKLKYYQFLDKLSVRKANLFISNSAAVAISNAASLKIPDSKVKVIHRGRDFDKFSKVSGEATELVRSQLNLQGKFVMLNVGRLLESKGQADIIHAFKKIEKDYPEAVLLIAGEGPYRHSLSELIKSLAIEDKVFLLGNRQDIEVLLTVADLFVFASYFEGLPGVIVEAMIAGKIIIASDIPECRECIDESCGFFFIPGDLAGIEKKMRMILNEPLRYLHMGDKARSVASEKFNIKSIAAKYEEAYDEVLKGI